VLEERLLGADVMGWDQEGTVAVLDHFNWGGQAGASCTVRGASYI